MGCVNWAWKIQGLKANEKLLLAVIADRADRETGVCTSPISRLSRDCGGWTRQQTNRVAKRLNNYDLVSISQRYPGTDNNSRMFTCNLAIDPEVWRPAPTRRLGTSGIMSTSAFQKLLRDAFVKTTKDLVFYENWLSALQIVEVKQGRLVCKLPSDIFSREIWPHHPLIIDLAQKHISKSIKKIRWFWNRPRKTET